MTSITSLTLEAPDVDAARAFYDAAFGLDDRIQVAPADEPSSGFRGFSISLVVGQPSTVDSLLATAVDAGARTVKPATKALWGYGAVLEAPDGAIWKIATSKKKESGERTRQIDDIVLLIGVADMRASKRAHVERGLPVKRSFLPKYVEFDSPGGGVKLALYGRKAILKDAGVAEHGTGSRRLRINGDGGPFVDPDGFVWT